jgi:hypothetical protein
MSVVLTYKKSVQGDEWLNKKPSKAKKSDKEPEKDEEGKDKK